MELIIKGNTLIIPKGITRLTRKDIDNFISDERNEIKEIILPKGLEIIGEFTFNTFQSLEKINFPESLRAINKAAFIHCKSLKNVQLNEGLEFIGEYVFTSCNLNVLNIPSTVKDIQPEIISNNKNLNKITVSKDNPIYSDMDCNVIYEKMSNTLIQACKSSIIPESTKMIGERAFTEIEGLEVIVLPKNVEYIHDTAFSLAKTKTYYIECPIDKITPFVYGGVDIIYMKNIDKSSKLYYYYNDKIKQLTLDSLIEQGNSTKEVNDFFKKPNENFKNLNLDIDADIADIYESR